MRIIRRFITAVTVLFFVLVAFGWISILSGPTIEDDSVLRVTLDGPLRETPAVDLGILFGEEPRSTLRAVILSLERAATDERIKGVVLEIGNPQVGLAQLEELESAMDRYRKSGKWSLAFLETAGELSRGDGAYALATLADKVTLAPAGDLNLIGLRSEPLFFKGTIDLLGVELHMEKRGKYKSAANQYTDREMDEPMREALAEVIEDLQSQLIELVARRREVPVETVREWINGGPHSAQDALAKGMVDRLGYADEVVAEYEERAGREDSLVAVGTYWLEGRPMDDGRLVAVVYGEGGVTRGDPTPGPFDDEPVMASDPLIRAFRTLRDDGAEAVVFRVDSPGGSYLASDLIRREVQLTREAGIPVVVSMGNVAASGGYFVAMDADLIMASPSTITGSIGVFTGLLNVSGLFAKAGVSHDSYQTAPNADLFSQLAPLDERRRGFIARQADRIYADFTSKVADKRGLPLPKVQAVAQGRVWSGRDALEHGLVDELGGLRDAIEKARVLAEIGSDEPIELRPYPRPDSPAAALRSILRGTIEAADTLHEVREPLERVGVYWDEFSAVSGDAPLTVPIRLPRLY